MSDVEARRAWREDHAIEAFKEQRDLDEDAELARYREVISVHTQRARDMDKERRGEVRIRGTNPDGKIPVAHDEARIDACFREAQNAANASGESFVVYWSPEHDVYGVCGEAYLPLVKDAVRQHTVTPIRERAQFTEPRHNPKHIRAQKDGKAPMHLLPWKALAQVARVLAGGADKYGERNWRIDEILASTYEGAIGRHAFLEWAQGVDADPDSGLHPLAHVAASCLIVLDAIDQGTFIDDRDRKETKDPEASS